MKHTLIVHEAACTHVYIVKFVLARSLEIILFVAPFESSEVV